MMVEFVDWGSVWEQFDEWSERAQANSKQFVEDFEEQTGRHPFLSGGEDYY